MRRMIGFFLAAVALISMFAVQSFAAEVNPGESGIMPCYEYVKTVTVNLDISDDGTATATSKITGYSGTTTKVYITMYLERKEDGKWKTVESWSDSAASYRLTLEESVDVDSGYTYRVRASCQVYAGSNYEFISEYSGEIEG